MLGKSVRSMLIGAIAGVTVIAGAGIAPATAQPPDSVTAGFQPLALFDDYISGSLREQGPWHVNTPGAADGAFASSEVPASLSGKALALLHGGTNPNVQYRGNAYASLGDLAIEASARGTLFFEVLADDPSRTRLNVGLSADDSPGLGADTTGDALDLNDFGPQFTIDERGLVARDGAAEVVLDAELPADGILRVWLDVDNENDAYTVHTAAPGEAPQPATGAQGEATFAFRTATADPLVTLLVLNDPDDLPTAPTWLDSIFVSPSAGSTADPAPAFSSVVDFQNLTAGAINGQDGWTATAGATIAADPADAANSALQLVGANTKVHRALDAIEASATGTLFFRFQRSGLVDTSIALTDVDAPAAFGDSRVQANNQRSSVLNVRPPAGFTPVGTWAENTWQCVWMVADNTTDTFTIHSRGGEYVTTTQLPVDQAGTYGFRSQVAGALDRFFVIQGATSPGTQWIDDIAIDPASKNLRVPSGDASDCEASDVAEAPLSTPVPRTPLPSDVTFHLSDVTTIPGSAAGSPRINFLAEVPGRDDVYAVPDLNGRLWLVDDGAPTAYLDATTRFPDFVRSPSLGTGLGFVAHHPEFARNGRFYTVHTEAGAALTAKTPTLPAPSDTRVHGVITEWTATDPSASTFEGTSREVLRIGFSRFLHGIQQIGFNPTAAPDAADYGKLYIAVGDGNENPNFAPDPQNPGKPQGKLLRIDPAGTNGPGAAYGIPADNPFVGQAGALGEVWALGFRNPHRFSWDAADGRMFVGQIGEKTIDSIYQIEKGDNAGWNEREGSFVFKKSDSGNVYPLPADDDANGYDYPVLDLGRNTGVSLVTGFAYRGEAHPEFDGGYVFGDIVDGDIRYTSASALRRGQAQPMFYGVKLVGPDGAPTTMPQLAGSSRVDLRFGTDAEGEIYLLSKANGKIWKVTDVTGVPERTECEPSGVVLDDIDAGVNWSPLTPSNWEFPGDEIVLKTPGTAPTGPRRPFEYATLTAGPELGSLRYEAEVRLDESTSASNRDVVLIWNYQSPTKFYYAHLSQDNAIYPHNGIFVVNDADRVRIDDQWTGKVGAPRAVDDMLWHDVRLDYCADTGEIAVYVDNSEIPLMTATDTAFSGGRVGFGSFDNFGRARDVSITATPLVPPTPPLDVSATAQVRCVFGQPFLTVWIANREAVPVAATLTSEYGTRKVTSIAPGRSAFRVFVPRASGIADGSVGVEATATIDGLPRSIAFDAAYTGRDCR
ncbi:PQQ-dependent sugar dehydrogenase [Agromyces humatus]|uniref:Glucose/Sorbosone dehydrogenase domain-containing protein n=1 Tax=Agromyces humatus TaxID=279573 RepID=A0ABP4X3T3_9MICO|nr:PQQ-dependent sugar dehydrogenase [Agromyces humatus]